MFTNNNIMLYFHGIGETFRFIKKRESVFHTEFVNKLYVCIYVTLNDISVE